MASSLTSASSSDIAIISSKEYEEQVLALEIQLCELMHKTFEDERDRLYLPRLYSKINPSNVFKILFMERKKLDSGKFSLDAEEKGYLKGVLKGYICMLETLHLPLNASLYETLHDEVSSGVFSSEDSGEIPRGFREFSDGMEAFYLTPEDTVSIKGIEELIIRYDSYHYIDNATGDKFFFLKEAMSNPKVTILKAQHEGAYPKIVLKPTRKKTCEVNIEELIKLYEMKPKSTDDEKLHAIARLCQDLDQLHVFVDGNIRTTGILVLNRLLILNGLSPCVLKDVNQLDCLSEDEIVELIKEGQDFFRSL